MTLIEKIPELDDAGLRNMLDNARRLHEGGDARQREKAAELLPHLEAAMAERQEIKRQTAAAKRGTTKRAVAKAAATATNNSAA